MEKLAVSSKLFEALEHIKNNNYPLRSVVENYHGIYDLVKKELTSGEEFLALEYISGNNSNDIEIIVNPYENELRESGMVYDALIRYTSNEISIEELQMFGNIVDFGRSLSAQDTLKEWDKYHEYFKN